MTSPSGTTLGIDVGGTRIKWALVDAGGTPLRVGSLDTPRVDEVAVIRSLGELVTQLRDDHPDLARVGLAIPGHLDRKLGVTTVVPNLPGNWRGFGLRSSFADRTGIVPSLMNDARAFALAELSCGSARGIDHAVFVTVGTGVGGAAAIGSTILRNSCDSVGELGHITVRPDGLRCGCGGLGCAEAYAGGQAIVQRGLQAGLFSSDGDPGGAAAPATPDLIRRQALAGNVIARQILEDAYWALASAVTSACVLLGVGTVVIGGGLGRQWPEFGIAIAEKLCKRHELLGSADVVTASIGDSSGAIGAALAALSEQGTNSPAGATP